MVSALLYSTVFLYIVLFMTLVVAFKLYDKSYTYIHKNQNTIIFALIISVILAYWLGMRPASPVFGDSYYYRHSYALMVNNIYIPSREGAEWLWDYLTYTCSQKINISQYFTLIAFGYFGFTLWACRILFKNNVVAALLFVMGAFSFYSYAVNGIRNGLACSMALTVIALMSVSRKNLVLSLCLAFVAANIHTTSLLPLVCLFVSVYWVKSFKVAYIFWLLSIIISLFAGNSLATFFAGLGFDDRLSYLTDEVEDKFSHTGFRWDFLIYSMMPIVLGYYIVIKRGIQDKTYLVLLNTYTLANAFWVMVIRANYSNRFAYLSWFMYPIVLAYPLFSLDIWSSKQGLYLSRIMIANIGFTWVMSVFM